MASGRMLNVEGERGRAIRIAKRTGEWLFSRSSAIIFHVNCNPRAGAGEAPDNDLWARKRKRRKEKKE